MTYTNGHTLSLPDALPSSAQHKLKKDNGLPPSLELAQNPDIRAGLSEAGSQRPSLVGGFAAETEKVVEHARLKLDRKGCDWILANDVAPGTATFGGDRNRIQLVTAEGVDDWPQMTKAEVAERLCRQIPATLGRHSPQPDQGTRSLKIGRATRREREG